MTYLPQQQLLATIAQLDQAIYAHEQWYKSLVRTLVARLPPDAADLLPDAHRRCRFGMWYGSDSTLPLRSHPSFEALGHAHERMHGGGTRLLQRTADGLPLSADDLDQFDNVLDRMRLEIQSLRRELVELAQNRDSLTGAHNRASLLADLREQLALVRRGTKPCALAMIDLDHFKDINDRYGHAAGDAVLVSTVRCLHAILRPYDRLYRYGGEEFLLCMPHFAIEAAASVAERLRAEVAAQRIPIGAEGKTLQVTASFGVAALDADTPVEESIDLADRLMYQAKAAGRNRVVASDRKDDKPESPGTGRP